MFLTPSHNQQCIRHYLLYFYRIHSFSKNKLGQKEYEYPDLKSNTETHMFIVQLANPYLYFENFFKLWCTLSVMFHNQFNCPNTIPYSFYLSAECQTNSIWSHDHTCQSELTGFHSLGSGFWLRKEPHLSVRLFVRSKFV